MYIYILNEMRHISWLNGVFRAFTDRGHQELNEHLIHARGDVILF